MSSPPERRNPWALSGEAFERLLAAFAPSREEAALRYESLRLRLVRYFTWERCPFPDERADEALNRVARRLEEGEPVHNIEQYAAGVARLLAKESVTVQIRRQRAYNAWALTRTSERNGEPDTEFEANCLEECLREVLTPEERDFLLEYYQGDRQVRIQSRQRMAERLGIGLNALRNRALRLREKLDVCLRDRLWPPGPGSQA